MEPKWRGLHSEFEVQPPPKTSQSKRLEYLEGSLEIRESAQN